MCSCRCQCVISDVRYQKWAALNLSFQTILHVYLICFCMSISLVITSVHWCSVSNRDKLCASSIILFIASFLSTSFFLFQMSSSISFLQSIALFYYIIIQQISSSKSYFNELNQEFKLILNINIITQLKYLILTSWLNLNT